MGARGYRLKARNIIVVYWALVGRFWNAYSLYSWCAALLRELASPGKILLVEQHRTPALPLIPLQLGLTAVSL